VRERLSALCQRAFHAAMACSLADSRWWAIVWGSWWFGGRGLAAPRCASSMQRVMPCGLCREGHHSSWIVAVLKMEKIYVSGVQKSREWNWPAWARRLVMA